MVFDHKKFASLLAASGKSQLQVAKEAGLSTSASDFSNWKLGKKRPGLVALDKLEKYFGASLRDGGASKPDVETEIKQENQVSTKIKSTKPGSLAVVVDAPPFEDGSILMKIGNDFYRAYKL